MSRHVRQASASMIQEIQGLNEAEHIQILSLLQDQNEIIATYAKSALNNLKPQGDLFFSSLRALIQKPEISHQVRANGIYLLGTLKAQDPQTQSILLNKGLSHTDRDIRMGTAQALIEMKIHDPRAHELIGKAIQREADVNNRNLLIQALGAGAPQDAESQKILSQELTHKQTSIVGAASSALKNSAQFSAKNTPLLIPLLKSSQVHTVQGALQLIAHEAGELIEAQSALIKTLTHKKPEIRKAAREYLQKIQVHESLQPDLVALLKNRKSEIRESAMENLASMARENFKARLQVVEGLKHSDPGVRKKAFEGLKAITLTRLRR